MKIQCILAIYTLLKPTFLLDEQLGYISLYSRRSTYYASMNPPIDILKESEQANLARAHEAAIKVPNAERVLSLFLLFFPASLSFSHTSDFQLN